MRFFRMLREHLHISAKTVIYGEMLVLSLLCLSIFLFKTDPGQAVISQASRLAGYMNPWKTRTARTRTIQRQIRKRIKIRIISNGWTLVSPQRQ